MSAVGAIKPGKESERLVRYRKKLRFTQSAMAAELGVELSTYKNWEYKTDPPPEKLETARQLADGVGTMVPKDKVPIPVIGYVGAGDDRPMGDGEREPIYVSSVFAHRGFGAAVLGADSISMLPYLHPGDTAIFQPTKLPKVGYLIAARLPDQPECIVKELVFEKGQLALRSFNPEVPDIIEPGMQIVGYLVGFESADELVRIGPETKGITRAYLEDLKKSRFGR